jgi:RNA polymerase sigma factor (TIGR02999 family)
MCDSEQKWLMLKKNCAKDLKRDRQRCPEISKNCRFNELTSASQADIFPSKDSGSRWSAVPGTTSQHVSELLAKWRAGDEESLRRLVPLVYNELRRLAHYHMRKERPNHTLQTTALVHEAYLCLMKQEPMLFENRAHFFAVCANLMRQILVQYPRRRKAAKRDARYKLTIDGAIALPQTRSVDLVAFDDALNELAKLDPQQSRIVELRFFAGLSIEETSHVLASRQRR